VNDIEEGIELREHGIEKPVLVFEVPQKSRASKYRVHNLTATISSEEHFEWLPNGTSYHLNFDTGMGRLGFLPSKAQRVSTLMEENRELFCTGIYSHFATADEPESDLVHKQLDQFRTILQFFPDEINTHISNTGALAFYNTEQFNMVRLGIGMYGYPPGETQIEGLKPALSWETKLVQTKRILANSTVSYGANWQAPTDGFLGILPVGYEDGLRRNLSDNIVVGIEGDSYEIVGTITMNYCMIFMAEKKYPEDTTAHILYSGQDAGNWARKLRTIPYEILTSISPKIPRQYI
jgi:alanine racemase